MSPPPGHPPVIAARSGRPICLPARYIDYLPTGNGLRHVPSPPPSPLSPQLSTHSSELEHPPPLIEYRTQPTDMGLFRVYPTQPTHICKGEDDIHSFVDAPTLDTSGGTQDTLRRDDSLMVTIHGLADHQITRENLYSAFSSPTAGILMCWQYSGTNTKSAAELNRLWSFIKDPQFQPSLHHSFNHEREKKLVEKYLHADCNPFKADHGWKTSAVSVLLPHEQSTWPLGEHDPSVPVLEVKGVHHRDITDIIVSTLQDLITSTFHLVPFKEYWQPDPASDPIRVFGEAYSSGECLDAYQKIHSLPRDPGDDLERIVIPLMLWSDATQLANFGDASLWPVYLFFGNQSKYTRGKPTAAACHHVAYIPTVRRHQPYIQELVTHQCLVT